MERRGSLILISLLLLSFTITTLLTLAIATNYRESHSSVTTKLIHRDSIYSLSYNPNDTIEDRAKRMVKASNARFNYLQQKTKRSLLASDYNDDYGDTSDANDAYEANLFYDFNAFVVNFSIGQPPSPQYAVMDTGSSLIWVQCEPCKECFKQKGPIYDSSSSSTYVELKCSDPDCDDTACKTEDELICIYNISYEEGSKSGGVIGKEQLLFETPDDGIIVLNDVMFGCGDNNKRISDNGVIHKESGVFGLGRESPLIEKLGFFGFSYCIGNTSDPLYDFNRLTLGSKLKAEGYSTPLTTLQGHYYVTVEGISIGQKRLDIDPRVFMWLDLDGSFKSKVMIDTGSTITYIPKEAYDVVRDKVSSLLSGFLQPVSGSDQRNLCYKGKLNRDLEGFPVATLHLKDGADLVLDIESLFFQETKDVVCLALEPSPNSDHAHDICLIGILAQQYYNVAFDLKQNKLYLQRIECALMID